MTYAKPIVSPCISVCAVSGQTKLCVGCARSLKEIAGWAQLTHEERDRVMRALPDRLDAMGELASNPEAAKAKIADALSS